MLKQKELELKVFNIIILVIYTILSLITFVLFCIFKLELLVSSLLSLFYGVSLLHSIK